MPFSTTVKKLIQNLHKLVKTLLPLSIPIQLHISFSMSTKTTLLVALLFSSLSYAVQALSVPHNQTSLSNSTGIEKLNRRNRCTDLWDFPIDWPIGYGATFFPNDNCQGDPVDVSFGPYVNFGCSKTCHSIGAARSVYIEADRYSQKPVLEDAYTIRFDRTDRKYENVHTDGPVVLGYSSSNCQAAYLVSVGKVLKGLQRACHVFKKHVYSVHLKLLKDCECEESRASADRLQLHDLDVDTLKDLKETPVPENPDIEEYQSMFHPDGPKMPVKRPGIIFPPEPNGWQTNKKDKYRFEVPSYWDKCHWTKGHDCDYAE
ncbi:hypothetical protein VHEMI06446 [[Torrubiella] hemipterigena]|uniref:Uncharacterized protein n=1 Tax=[Torrubiella] hemipterigena TaxID=1531966 RepID=A0A0A1T7C7_9HYPO|nr:hypothetical protein VHEMI06446 [[Torrubiella] hemipterigena]